MVLKVKDFIHLMQVLDPEAYVSADIPDSFGDRLDIVCSILTHNEYFYFNNVEIEERNIFYLKMTADGEDDGRRIINTGWESQKLLKKNDPDLYNRIYETLKPKD